MANKIKGFPSKRKLEEMLNAELKEMSRARDASDSQIAEDGSGPRRNGLDNVVRALQNILSEQIAAKNELVQFSSPGLCTRCQTVDLDEIFDQNKQLSANGRKIMVFDILMEQLVYSSCQLCSLVHSVYPFGGRRHLRVLDLNSLHSRGSIIKSNDKTLVMAVLPGNAAKLTDPMARELALRRGVIAPVQNHPSGSTSAEPRVHEIDPLNANFRQIRNWLRSCDVNHGDACHRQRSIGMDMKIDCIDCDTLRIVSIQGDTEYFALSYVWGPHQEIEERYPTSGVQTCTANGPSILDFPRTIRDAIQVVRQLQGRYLWVDRYGVDQTNVIRKNDQINKMNLIFQQAYATIVAAQGDTAEDPMPGVSAPRQEQPRATIGGHHLVSTLPHLSDAVRRTRWVTRGWTYQELMLSRRCLFFTRYQVYFLCRESTWSEALDGLAQAPRWSLSDSTSMNTDILDYEELLKQRRGTRQIRLAGLWRFKRHLERFTQRQLTVPEDRLNAFQGILSALSYQSLWGLPIALADKKGAARTEREYNIGVARGLWWELDRGPGGGNRGDTVRVLCYPSWSWVGWTGYASIQGYDREKAEMEIDETCVELSAQDHEISFQVQLKNKQRLSVKQFVERSELSGMDLTHSLFCRGIFVRLMFANTNRFSVSMRFGPVTWVVVNPDNPSQRSEETCAGWDSMLPGTVDTDLECRLFTTVWLGLVVGREKWTHRIETKDYRLLLFDGGDGENPASRIGQLKLTEEDFEMLPKEERQIELI